MLGPGGLELPPGASADVSVPHAWIGNWSPRTGCQFDASGHGPCATGSCAGGSLACTEDASVVPMDRTQVRSQPLAQTGGGVLSCPPDDCSQSCCHLQRPAPDRHPHICLRLCSTCMPVVCMRCLYTQRQRLHAWSACSAGWQCSQKLCWRLADNRRRNAA